MTVWWPTSTDGGSKDVAGLPAGRRVAGRLRPPSSKSLTHRALALALLSRQRTVLVNPLESDDTGLFLAALRVLGHRTERAGDALEILPPAFPATGGELFCGNAGTMFRFLVAIAATLPGAVRIDGVERLRERPVRPLTDALRQLGVAIDFAGQEGHAPLVVRGGRLAGGAVHLDASASSQYLSALLLAGQRAEGPLEIRAPELASAPYIDLTLDMIATFGGRVDTLGDSRWIAHPSALRATEVEIEADYSAAAYPAAAAALTGGKVRIDGAVTGSRQGDRRLLELLAEMGAQVAWSEGGVTVGGGSRLVAIDADLGDIPDQVPTLAALAPFAHGTTRIRNVAHLRIKESDRLAAMTSELRKAGAEVDELPDGLVVHGSWAEREPPDDFVLVDPHGDHRIAMAMALVGLRRPNLHVGDPGCVAKSYPDFWRDLARLVEATA
ncbi:MAG: 3-phosphoshikimate 1-carboxyvinyltransferase [Thermoanaerobaculia bacterium]